MDLPTTYRDVAGREGSMSCDVCRSWDAVYLRGPDKVAFGAACAPCERAWLDSGSLDTWSQWVEKKHPGTVHGVKHKQKAAVAPAKGTTRPVVATDYPMSREACTACGETYSWTSWAPRPLVCQRCEDAREAKLDPNDLSANKLPTDFDKEPANREISEAEMIVLAEVKTVAAEKLAALKSEVYRIGKGLLQRTLAAWPTCAEHGPMRLDVSLDEKGARLTTWLSCACNRHQGPRQLTPLHVQRAFVNAGSPTLVVSE